MVHSISGSLQNVGHPVGSVLGLGQVRGNPGELGKDHVAGGGQGQAQPCGHDRAHEDPAGGVLLEAVHGSLASLEPVRPGEGHGRLFERDPSAQQLETDRNNQGGNRSTFGGSF